MTAADFSWVPFLLLAVAVPVAFFLFARREDAELERRKNRYLKAIDNLIEQSNERSLKLHELLKSPWVRLSDIDFHNCVLRFWADHASDTCSWNASIMIRQGARLAEFTGTADTAENALDVALRQAKQHLEGERP